MGRRGKCSTFEQRQLVVYHHAKGKTCREIAAIVNMKKSTVHDIIKRFEKEDRLEFRCSTGRPRTFSQRDERVIVRKVQQNPKISATRIASEVEGDLGIKVHPETVRRVLRRSQYHGRVARRKPFINAVNQKKRMQFAREYAEYDQAWWNRVIFCDECKFTLWQSDGKANVWRKTNEELNPRNLKPTVKFGGGSIMVWGCMSGNGVGDLVFIDDTMNKEAYLNILRGHLKQSARHLGIANNFHFYQDNDPKHTAHIVQMWLLFNCPKVLHPLPNHQTLTQSNICGIN